MKLRYLPRYTYDDYYHWKGDWELIDGIPFTIPRDRYTAPHQRIMTKFVVDVMNQLVGKDKSVHFTKGLDWIIDNITVVRPDVMIAVGEPIEKFLEYPPIWIVEILCEPSVKMDQIVKKELYAEQGVRYYLIADPDKKTLIVYELINGEYHIKPDGHFDLTDHCSIDLDTEAIMNS